MKPPSFEYAAPKSVAEAVTLLQQYDGDAKILSGGQSLMPLLNMRLARPAIRSTAQQCLAMIAGPVARRGQSERVDG